MWAEAERAEMAIARHELAHSSATTLPAARLRVQGPFRTVRALVALTRPRQWYKNALVLTALVFSHNLFDARTLLVALGAFAVFCALSSAVYATNDVIDAAQDRLHPKKRARPVASGAVSPALAGTLAVGLASAALAGALAISRPLFLVALAYAILQALYVTTLKHHVFLDLFSIASGFVLRAVAGVAAIAAPFSPWLVVCTFFLALFLGLGKRRAELRLLGEGAAAHRPILGEYSEALIDRATTIVTSSLLLAYALYTFGDGRTMLVATIPLVAYGLLRYLYLVSERDLGGEPDVVFRDRPSLVNLGLWGVLVVAILYGAPEAVHVALGPWLSVP